MKIEDIKTSEEAAKYLVKSQRMLVQLQNECRALEQRFDELEQAESKSKKESK